MPVEGTRIRPLARHPHEFRYWAVNSNHAPDSEPELAAVLAAKKIFDTLLSPVGFSATANELCGIFSTTTGIIVRSLRVSNS